MTGQPSLFPDYRAPAPSAPGSESSRRAAERMTVERRRPRWLQILEALAAARYAISREELSHRTGIKESTLCGRLNELAAALCVDVSEGSCISAAGERVNGYRISESGRRRLSEAA